LDDQEDIAEEVPAKSDRGPADPKADGKQLSGAEIPSEKLSEVPSDAELEAIASETGAEADDDAAGPAAQPAPRLYQLRPAGLRPVRRRLRRHGLRNDCPPDQRRWPRSSSPRTRLR
jgi:hypothetical protein